MWLCCPSDLVFGVGVSGLLNKGTYGSGSGLHVLFVSLLSLVLILSNLLLDLGLIFMFLIVVDHSFLLSWKLLTLLILSLNVVLWKVAVLAHTSRVVRSVKVTASICHLGLSLAMVAVVTHVLGVVLPVSVWTEEDFSSLSLAWLSGVLSLLASSLCISWGRLFFLLFLNRNFLDLLWIDQFRLLLIDLDFGFDSFRWNSLLSHLTDDWLVIVA